MSSRYGALYVPSSSAGVSASVAVNDGADVLASNVSPIVGTTSATTEGADVLASNVSPIVATSSATTDGSDALAANVSPIVALSSAFTDGVDVLAAQVAPQTSIGFSSSTTGGSDSLAASVNSGLAPVVPFDGLSLLSTINWTGASMVSWVGNAPMSGMSSIYSVESSASTMYSSGFAALTPIVSTGLSLRSSL